MPPLADLPFPSARRLDARLHRVWLEDGSSRLLIGSRDDSAALLSLLQREYAFRSALSGNWAATPEALIPSGQRLLLLASDPGGQPLRQLAQPDLPVRRFLRLACAVTAAVSDMHRSGVLHRALTPDRILVDERTGGARLLGFGMASRLDDGIDIDIDARPPGDEAAEWDDASFDYLAPELGARMNVRPDVRADLYALGAIFHELLVHAPLFEAADAAARLHAHATRRPALTHRLRPDVPMQLSRIIGRLLEKPPELRYADASALLADLTACEQLLDEHGGIPTFALNAGSAMADWDHAMPVLGRDPELGQLQALYETVRTGGGARTAFVHGDAGIGKSRLLRELVARLEGDHAPLVAAAKCMAAASALPFDAMTRALRPLLQVALSSEEREFARWRQRLREAAHPVSATVASLLPELRALLDLPADEASPQSTDLVLIFERELVMHAMGRLIAAFARPERPLVLVLDDLQWADEETLRLLDRLLADHAEAPLLVLGSIRSPLPGLPTPPSPAPNARVAPLHLVLAPIDSASTRQLIAGALGQAESDTAALAELQQLVETWTGCNPFFIRRLLSRLLAGQLLRHDPARRAWTWDLRRIRAEPGLYDVGGLLALDLKELAGHTLSLLQALAALGDRVATPLLALAGGVAPEAVPPALAAAAEAGFVSADGDAWGFTHDHVREAVLASQPASTKAALHLAIARRLRSAPPASVPVYLLATQANFAIPSQSPHEERRAFALANLEAGRRAKAATAHAAALVYFRQALRWFDGDRGEETLQAALLCGEAEFMTGALTQAEERLAGLADLAGDGVFGAELARLRAALYTALGRYDDALDVGLDFLRQAGFELPRRPGDAQVEAEYRAVREWLDTHGMQALRDLPNDTDPRRRAIVDVFADLLPPALYSDQRLVDLMLLRMVRLAIAHGHADASANGYVCMIQVLGARQGDFATSRAFGELALHLVNERGLSRYQARVLHTYATFVVPWTAPARSARPYFDRAFDIATRVGDHTFALYCGRNRATGMLFAGEYLTDVRLSVEPALARARDAGFQLVVDALLAQRALLNELQGIDLAGNGSGAVQAAVEETMAEPLISATPTLVDLAYWVYRLQAALLFGDTATARRARLRAEACQGAGRAFAEYGDLAFYGALALLADATGALPGNDEQALRRHMADLGAWASHCPENFGARWTLVRAEHARHDGRSAEAAELYADAVAQARRHQLTQVEALAAELAAAFHLARDRAIEGRAYLRHALAAWQRWGAAAKQRELLARHADLLEPEAASVPTTRLHTLDVQAVLRISHALGGELVPERVVDTTMRTALESAGAEYGALALLRGGSWLVRATARVRAGAIVVTQQQAPVSSEVLPVSVLHAVARAQQAAQLDDARESQALAQDEYVKRHRPRSLLCVPMMRRGQLIGVLHLENNLAPRVFTAAKAELLEVIASQAAFALENTRLYEEAVDQHLRRAAAEERLRAALTELERASRLKAMGELVASIVHEIGQPLSAIDTSASAAGRWLDRAQPDVGEALAMVRHVGLSARRAKTIIQGLRAMTRKAEPRLAEVDLGETLRECATLVGGSLAELGVTLEIAGGDAAARVMGDRVQLQQVVINLLMNGAEAMHDTPAEWRRLSLSWGNDAGGRVRVVVEDRGEGIAPEALGQILEPFFTTKASGMGMGLAICKSIVSAHGGTLVFSAASPRGTRVVLELPAAEDAGGGPESDRRDTAGTPAIAARQASDLIEPQPS